MPDDVMRAAQALSIELGTSPNDALVKLAEEGLNARQRRQAAEALAAERRAAVGRAGLGDLTGFPSPEELQAAMLSGRREP